MAAPSVASGRCIMNESEPLVTSRRDFLKTTGKVAAVSALAGVSIPHVHAAGSDTIQIALVGCGGRGGGAAANALEAKGNQIGRASCGERVEAAGGASSQGREVK